MIGSEDCRTEEQKERNGPGGRIVSGAAEGRAGGRKSESGQFLISDQNVTKGLA